MFKRCTGITLLVLIAAAPFMLITSEAFAIPETDLICYVGPRKGRLGIVLEVSHDTGERLVRKRVGTFAYGKSFKTFRGYNVCVPIHKGVSCDKEH